MSAVAAAVPRERDSTRVTSFFFLATFFCVTFEKIHWQFTSSLDLSDILTVLFLVFFAGTYRGRMPKTAGVVLAFLGVFLVVYLLGFFNIQTQQALDQFVKGMVKFVLHFVFLAAGITFLSDRGRRYFWRTLGWFAGGILVNCIYGILQLLSAKAGQNLDTTVLSPLTGGASSINIYGQVNGANVFRPNALTGDPNHLGIFLDVPLLVLLPVYLRLERGHPWRRRLAIGLGFMFLMLLATLSRSGLLGLGVGLLVLLVPYRRFVLSRALLYPLGGIAVILTYILYSRWHYFSVVLRSRIQTQGSSSSAHFAVYSYIPQVLHANPLLGFGLNTFSVYYQFVTGKTNWGPHSFWVALVVETGLIGLLLYLIFLRYVYVRLKAARVLGRIDRASGALPLAYGFAAALTGTMAANFFYLTMSFYYFYALLALALALPIVFARRR